MKIAMIAAVVTGLLGGTAGVLAAESGHGSHGGHKDHKDHKGHKGHEAKGSTTATAPGTQADAKAGEQVGNTKCVVTGEDAMDSGASVSHKGKVYMICCGGCADDFAKDPEKYVKALEADPAKFGVPAKK